MKFYITTAIDYVNAPPHIGHAYEKICADVIARWNSLLSKKVFFLTGTDEHGLKIERAAREAKINTKKFVDEIAKKFKEMDRILNISYNDFIRTTEKRHIKFCQNIFFKINKKGLIYKGIYKGKYCAGCEKFLTAADMKKGKCIIHNVEPEIVDEETYFFRMSKFYKKIMNHIKKNKNFIVPEGKRREILNRLKEPLHDLSVSRCTFKWGIPLPIDKKHVIYVWFDALLNYLSAIQKKKLWPADLHIIGHDILWFHAVIWPAILLAMNKELPKKIFVHGFLTVRGEKISKSLGNIIDPIWLAKKYSSDSLRYFLLREIPLGQDGDFDEEALKKRHNTELADKLGNLVSRISGLASKKISKGKKGKIDSSLTRKLNIDKIKKHMEAFELDKALAEIFAFIDSCNKYVQEKKVWNLKGKEFDNAFYTLAESLRIISILLYAFMPSTSEKINKQLNIKEKPSLKNARFGLMKAAKIKKAEILFKKC